MKHLKKFNEGGDYNDCRLCHGEGREPYCPICGKQLDYGSEIQTKPGFVEKRLSQQKEYESKYTISLPVPVSAYELLKNKGVSDDNIVRAYTEYVNHSLGLNTHTVGVDEFRVWCEELKKI